MPKNIVILTIAAVALVVVGTVAYLGLSPAPTQEQQEQGGQGMREEAAPAVTQPAEAPKVPFSPPEEVSSVPTTPSTQAGIDTSDWKTYRNKEFGFEIKSPLELVGYERMFASDDVVGGISFRLPNRDPRDQFFYFYGRRFLQFDEPDLCEAIPATSQFEREIGGVRLWEPGNFPGHPPGRLGDLIYKGKHADVCYYLQFDPFGFYQG